MRIVGVVDESAEFVRGVAALLRGELKLDVRHVPTMSSVDAFLADTSASVVVVGPSVATDEALLLGHRLEEVGSHTSLVLVASAVDADLLRSALRSGLQDVVSADDSASELSGAVKEALEASEKRKAPVPNVEGASKRTGKVVTVFSMKGGVGKTVMATNLSVALASTGSSTVLVDLDLQFGDCGIMLGLEPSQTIAEAAAAFDRLDCELLAGLLVSHKSGLKTLMAPVRPEQAESITPARITRIISLLQEMFEFVVLDTAATFDETALTALDRSDRVYAVTMMDIASIKNTRIALQKLRQLGYPSSVVQIVLNRADSKVLLEPFEVEKAIGLPIHFRVPSDRLVPRSVNKGVPVILEAPRSDVGKAIQSIAKATVESLREVKADVA